MSKQSRRKYYAVRVGREGPKVYETWSECHANVSKWHGAIYKSFLSQKEAEEWAAVPTGQSNSSSVNTARHLGQALASAPADFVHSQENIPKSSRRKYYAVHVGREGPKVYETWQECQANVSRWPGAMFKSFLSRKAAEEWAAMPAGQPLPSVDTVDEGRASPSTPADFDSTELSISFSPPSAVDHPQTLPSPPPSQGIILSPEQKKVLAKVERGENVFFTGSAGTGKSVLLREIIRVRGGRGHARLAITASTGIAGVNINGTTVHSWAGIGLGQEDAKKLAGKFLGQPKFAPVRDRWRDVETLIIDEISMIDGVLFDKLEYIARILRKNDSPFGGIQLVICGDFCQLPPVPDRNKDGAIMPALFAFEAKSWRKCIPRSVVLTKVFRQKEQGFVDMLNQLRWGILDDEVIQTFKSLARHVHYTDGIGPTELYPTRAEVERANCSKLDALNSPAFRYDATDIPGIDSYGKEVTNLQMQSLLDRLVAPRSLLLKVGAQVMLIKNLVQGHLVNGSVGQVIRFSTLQEASHNSTDIGTEDGAKGNKAEALKEIERYSDARWPVVRFTNGRELVCVPADFTVNNAMGEMEARRRQVPLILAWALSVHKSQGQTLERVKVDLACTFEKGQAYVALSRATSLDTLEVYNFNPSKIMVHPRVLNWHEDIEREEVMTVETHDEEESCCTEMDMDEAAEAYWSGSKI